GFVGACLIATFICLIGAIVTSRGDAPLWNFGPPGPYLELHPDASNKWSYFTYLGLASGIGIHPTYFALYLLACLLIVIRTVEKRWLMWLLVIYLLIFIMLLSSRIVVIATVAAFIAAVPKKKFLVAGLVAMLSIILINPLALYRNAQEYTRNNFSLPPAAMSDNPITIRMSLLWLSLHAIKETNPVIGTGTGDVEGTIGALQERYDVRNILNTSDPHNQYLHTYIALGAIGLVTLMVVFAAPLWVMFRQREFEVCAGLLAFMLVCTTESAMELQKGIVLFTLCTCMIGNQVREWGYKRQELKYA
ncbi:MAG TPA: O-antigen ligase family protein, partial [Cyclobacteriaceae bacterium]